MPAGLTALAVIPTLAGLARLVTLSGAADLTSDNTRFLADPVPAVLHIASANAFLLLGAWQLPAGIRRRAPRWHRRAGYALLPLGLLGALGGLWLTLAYPPVENDSTSLFVLRLLASGAMAGCLVVGSVALPRRAFAAHGAWMLRAYAIAMGAGTQVFTHIPYFLVDALHNEAGRTAAMASGWLLNLAIAEWILRSDRNRLIARPRVSTFFASPTSTPRGVSQEVAR